MGRKAKLWSWATGAHGSRVRVAERRPGGIIYAMTPRPGGGAWLKVSLGHRDRDRAMSEASALSARRHSGAEPLERLSVAAMFGLFSRSVLPRQCPQHQEELSRGTELWTRFLGGARKVESIGPSDWEAFQQIRATGELDGRGHRVEKPDDRRRVGPRTLARELKVLRAACRRATIERTAAGGFLLAIDPTRGLALPSERNPKRPTYDSARYDALLGVAHRVKMRIGFGKTARWVPSYLPMLIRLAGDSGRRISAILSLRWNDWLPAEGNSGAIRWRAAHDKGGREWVVPVSPAVETELQLERERRGIAAGSDALFFPSPNDPSKPVSKPVVTGWLRQAEKLAELEPMERGAWHPFRRMWACQRKHLPARDVAAAGGWKDVTVLQGVYEAADQETLEAVVTGGRLVKGILR